MLCSRYAGFKPQCKWRYGDTFGNDTAKYFQQRRSVTLQRTSKDPGVEWDNKIQFPAVYSNDPKLVIGARTRERDRWLAAPKYALSNRHDRDEEIKAFHTVSNGGRLVRALASHCRGTCMHDSIHGPGYTVILKKVVQTKRLLYIF